MIVAPAAIDQQTALGTAMLHSATSVAAVLIIRFLLLLLLLLLLL
jgi:hypothetical protein